MSRRGRTSGLIRLSEQSQQILDFTVYVPGVIDHDQSVSGVDRPVDIVRVGHRMTDQFAGDQSGSR